MDHELRDVGGLARLQRVLSGPALLCCLAAGACTTGDASTDDMSVAAGVALVISDAPAWGENQRWSVASDPALVIGVLEGAEEYQFVRVVAAARQSDGDLVVADAGTRTVRLYDEAGRFVLNLGTGGSGPGEFQEPAQVMIGPADAIRVWDDAAFRVTRFDADGALTGVDVVGRAGVAKALDPPLYPGSAQLLPGGDLVVRLVEKIGKTKSQFSTEPSRPRSGALLVSADVSEIDTLMLFGDAETVSVASVFGPLPIVPPLARTTQITIHGKEDRACIGEQAAPEIMCFGPGDARMVLRWSDEARAVRPEEVAAWREATMEDYQLKLSRDDAARLVDQVVPAEVRPPYSSLLLDHSGHLWVERGPTEERGAETVDYMVFDPAGALLGVVPLPPLEVLEIGDDYVVGVYRDEFGVQYLGVFDLRRPGL